MVPKHGQFFECSGPQNIREKNFMYDPNEEIADAEEKDNHVYVGKSKGWNLFNRSVFPICGHVL